MPTIKDIHQKIQDISYKYLSGMPHIHIYSLMEELKATREEIMPHLDELHAKGIIKFHNSLKDTFSLINKAKALLKVRRFG